MEAVLAATSVYLAIAWQVARDIAVEDRSPGLGAQLRVAVRVLLGGFAWPRHYWRILKRDWDNYFVD